jgi:hypothetical protein
LHMSRLTRFGPFSLLALSVLLWTAGCKSNQNQNAANGGQTPPADTSQAAAPDASSDPASANLAPVSNVASAPQASAPAASAAGQESAPASADAGASNAPASQATDDSDYGEQPVATAPEPPPALPEYQQPPAPGDDYLWTPGYWGYVSTGYYWVPGVWVQAPYQGALWTPGYWGWSHNHYGFYRGYWGPHIGFYGGVNYGFGYVGVGYQGGYWNSGHFFYNRAVNNINVTVIHNVYNRTVIVNNNVHVSFNGGPGGIPVRPRPAELAALREPHAPPMTAQVQIQHAASVNRANFVSVNHGRPAEAVIAKPLVADRDVHPVAPPAARNEAARPEARPVERPNSTPPARNNEATRPATEKPAPRAEPHPQPEVRPKPEEHAAPAKPRPEEHAAPAKPKPEEHAAPAKPKPEEHAAPEKPKPETKAAPKKTPEEKPKPEDEHPR